jgi:hypothetical protein
MTTNLLKPALLLALLAVPLAAARPALAGEIQFGEVCFKNDYPCKVTVRLYHADDLDRVFSSWEFRSRQKAMLTLKGDTFTIGGDWLIKVEFHDGSASSRRLVYKVGTCVHRTWIINASQVCGD